MYHKVTFSDDYFIIIEDIPENKEQVTLKVIKDDRFFRYREINFQKTRLSNYQITRSIAEYGGKIQPLSENELIKLFISEGISLP